MDQTQGMNVERLRRRIRRLRAPEVVLQLAEPGGIHHTSTFSQVRERHALVPGDHDDIGIFEILTPDLEAHEAPVVGVPQNWALTCTEGAFTEA